MFICSFIILIVNKLFVKKKKNELKLLCITNFSKDVKNQKELINKLRVGNSTLLVLVLYFMVAISLSETNIIKIKNDIDYLTYFVPGVF